MTFSYYTCENILEETLFDKRFIWENKKFCLWNFLKLSKVVSSAFYSRPCLHVAHLNTCANGANFVINCLKTRLNTLKSYYSILTCLHSLIFGRGTLMYFITQLMYFDESGCHSTQRDDKYSARVP